MKIKSIYMYETIMLISCIITCCLFYIVLKTCLGIMFFDWFWTVFICPPFLLGAVIVWKISKNNNWISLAMRQIIATNVLLISIMAIFCIGTDDMTTGYASMFSVIVALSSVLPILIGCYCYKRLTLAKQQDFS